MLIQIDKIAKQLKPLTEGSEQDTTDRIILGDLAPKILAKQVAIAIRNCDWTGYALPRTAIVNRLLKIGWHYPEAFFEEPQVRCPATGITLLDITTSDDWGFRMSVFHVIFQDGKCWNKYNNKQQQPILI